MSNNLMSQQFSVPDRQTMNINVSEQLDMPVSDTEMRMVSHAPNASALNEFTMSNGQTGFVGPLVHGFRSQTAEKENIKMIPVDHRLGFQGSQQFVSPNHRYAEVGTYFGSSMPSLPVKRKAEMESMGSHSISLHSTMPNKRATQTVSIPHSAGLSHPSATSKKGAQVQSKISSLTTQTQTLNKKMVRNDSGKTNSQRAQTPKGRTVQIESTSKVQESTEAVRSKMRESLAAALELACQNQDKSANEVKMKTENASPQISGTSQLPESDQGISGVASVKPENNPNSSSPKESANRPSDNELTAGLPSGDKAGDSEHGLKEFPLTNEDVSFTDNFFVKDELLQGNGLTWAWELDMGSNGTSEVLKVAKPEVEDDDVGGGDKVEQVRQSPQDLAYKIEGELFKLYGGVNKKYREKGRSLLFNLKDRNNPELRERVMSGDISPERLCSMTAEELASKELSEWRMAKAEELAQMVVLPDTDLNMRRLVKKTHKGEYQVERDDNISVEVKEERVDRIPEEDDVKDKDNVSVQRSGAENQDTSGRLIIPNDGTDLMQGMIVDEMKDADFLPPIVSLDEFMESLDSEPPFENLPVDAGQTKVPPSDKRNSEAGDKSVAADMLSKVSVDSVSDKAKKEVKKHKERMDHGAAEKSKQSPVVQKIAASESPSMIESFWQGSLQLSISSSVVVVGAFRSGEKTSTKEWPASLEVKGRVKLDAFQKFLKDLPMSRSRAVMVVHFSLEDSTSESEKASLSEAVDSYVSDERLGFAEPSPGAELYLCPPNSRILDMLSHHLSKDRAEILNEKDNGLIGVLVWRKAQLISPKSSSHHKNTLKRQQHTSSRRQHEKDANVNGNLTPKGPVHQPRPNPPPQDDGDDDIPPGFGPGTTRDDDDLPEFNFSGNVNPSSVNRYPHQSNPSLAPRVASSVSQRPVDQMRQLVQKYGQSMTTPRSRDTGVGAAALGLEPWDDDDDDDDIPEWRPQLSTNNYPAQGIQPHVPVGHQHLPRHVAAPPVAQSAATAWPQGPRYAANPILPVLPQHGSLGNQPLPGQQQQQFGMPVQAAAQPTDWRQGVPRSRAL